MTDTNSFVDEVTDELRRDRMSRLLRRWGWIALAAVVLLVGAASWNEWRRAQAEARAEAFGTEVLAALQADAPLEGVAANGEGRAAILALLGAGAGEDGLARRARLLGIIDDAALPQRLRDLAAIRAMLDGGTGDAARDAALLDALAVPGAPFRSLARELQAMRAISEGDLDGGAAILQALTEEADVGASTRRRASQALVAIDRLPGDA